MQERGFVLLPWSREFEHAHSALSVIFPVCLLSIILFVFNFDNLYLSVEQDICTSYKGCAAIGLNLKSGGLVQSLSYG